jgi:prepilin-type N-terminal cleavage/methylation domain-containing protein
MRRRSPTDRRGFTLVEVLVALVLAALVILGARGLLAGLSDSAARISRVARAADADANAERTLRALVGRLEIGTPDAGLFTGDVRSAAFTSWCDTRFGWQERCRVTLTADSAGEMRSLVARLSTGERLVLRRAVRELSFRYLADAATGGAWTQRWGAGLTAPVAIGVVVDGDTLIVRVGERG